MIYKEFYSEIGKLLYAVADIDHVITPQEKKKLQDIVKKELVPAAKQQKDAFGSDVAYYAEIEFDFLDEQISDAQTAFESFIDFIEDHYTAFDSKMKKVCIHITEELAAAYHGTNKQERLLIEKLKRKLKEMH